MERARTYLEAQDIPSRIGKNIIIRFARLYIPHIFSPHGSLPQFHYCPNSAYETGLYCSRQWCHWESGDSQQCCLTLEAPDTKGLRHLDQNYVRESVPEVAAEALCLLYRFENERWQPICNTVCLLSLSELYTDVFTSSERDKMPTLQAWTTYTPQNQGSTSLGEIFKLRIDGAWNYVTSNDGRCGLLFGPQGTYKFWFLPIGVFTAKFDYPQFNQILVSYILESPREPEAHQQVVEQRETRIFLFQPQAPRRTPAMSSGAPADFESEAIQKDLQITTTDQIFAPIANAQTKWPTFEVPLTTFHPFRDVDGNAMGPFKALDHIHVMETRTRLLSKCFWACPRCMSSIQTVVLICIKCPLQLCQNCAHHYTDRQCRRPGATWHIHHTRLGQFGGKTNTRNLTEGEMTETINARRDGNDIKEAFPDTHGITWSYLLSPKLIANSPRLTDATMMYTAIQHPLNLFPLHADKNIPAAIAKIILDYDGRIWDTNVELEGFGDESANDTPNEPVVRTEICSDFP